MVFALYVKKIDWGLLLKPFLPSIPMDTRKNYLRSRVELLNLNLGKKVPYEQGFFDFENKVLSGKGVLPIRVLFWLSLK